MDTIQKRHARRFLAGLLVAGALAPSGARAVAPAPNVIRGIDVSERGGAVELDIRGSRAPSYTVFKLQDPPRLVVDVAGGDVSAVPSPLGVSRGGVLGVSTAQYKDEKSAVGRVIVALDREARYEVTPRGESLVVRVQKGEVVATATTPSSPSSSPAPTATAAKTPTAGKTATTSTTPRTTPTAIAATTPTPSTTPTAATPPTPTATTPQTPTATTPPISTATTPPTPTATTPRISTAATTPTATAASTPAQAAPAEDNVVSRRTDAVKVRRPATALTGAKVVPGGFAFLANGPIARVEIIELRNPARLALDLDGLTTAPRAPLPGAAGFSQVRFGRGDGKVRVVLDAEGELPRYSVKRTARGLLVATSAARTARSSPSFGPSLKASPSFSPSPGPTATAIPTRARIANVKFSQVGGASRIEITGRTAHAVTRPDPRTLVLTLEGAELPRRLERSLDATSLGGPVTMVSSFNQPSTGQVRVVVSLRGEASDTLAETPSGLLWTVSPGQPQRHAPDEPVLITESRAQAAGFSAEAPSYALSGAPQKREYSGRRITLDFHDIEIRNLLRLIADVSKKNIVVADNVTGKVTVSLRNVPWDQALDIVLKAKGLDREELGNVIRVAKAEDIAKEQQARADAAKARAPLIPLKVRLIPVNFAAAKDVEKQVKDVLSERGTVTVDERTNVLIVKDVQEALARAEGLVRNLDTETPQVLIESRIIEASSNFSQAIGVQWGGNAAFSQVTGNPIPLAFPTNAGAAGAAGNTPNDGTAAAPRYVVNLPAAIGQGAGGGIGLVFGSASGAFNLNLRLTALENSGVLKTISAPKIATIDNKEATIGQGLSIPFSQVSASGVNTTFIEAKLELKVTPHVTADGSILMKIKATNNQPNTQLTGANGQPSISKREAETSVLVKDGDTTVIGGIYTRTTSTRTAEVPFFAKIPILGWFFRTKADQDDHTELLIFITPRILNKQVAAAAGGGA